MVLKKQVTLAARTAFAKRRPFEEAEYHLKLQRNWVTLMVNRNSWF
ncbi:hypothetical protein HDEF_1064 [Candidatus Hamiltonella defensa 5AT (Acyrthosiphon pisum)]|uniref:Uncharacterized protein n=1 Tax=Hamiltonella defensa subsp. Acyrthosiphon pisum (strain 5AT) TaxID=572265 RepID=C4K5A3_HAMD5|nr:hypothetical protein HDEF_1064 [Candidatus Hamiltonella defensa 5AT (Acyrthosiphon pisum)]